MQYATFSRNFRPSIIINYLLIKIGKRRKEKKGDGGRRKEKEGEGRRWKEKEGEGRRSKASQGYQRRSSSHDNEPTTPQITMHPLNIP